MMQKSKGFTILELIIVIAIIGSLIVASSSLTNSWIDGVQIRNAASAFQSSVLKAKTTALRNANSRGIGDTAAGVCIDDNVITVVAFPSTSSCTATDRVLIKRTAISNGVEIKENDDTAVSCLFFTSSGLLVATTGCVSDISQDFVVEKNNESTTVTLI
ncbi:MAG: prepilin-type N-terminal cleavage/methylation domain-containing protein [Venatoribacter sp.]